MGVASILNTDVASIFSATWSRRDGQVVPKTDDVTLSDGAVELDAVFLYADLAHSTTLATQFPSSTAAKIVRAYLSSMARLIKHNGGRVRSFDGDRVMGVFVGDGKNSAAAKCALQMTYAMRHIVQPKAESSFSSLATSGFELQHCVGIHRSEVLVVRGGVRGSNDLVFVGEAPNFAAKLSDVRDGSYPAYLTHQVYGCLNDESKLANGEDMWTQTSVTLGGDAWTCYKSSWHWEP